MNATRMYSAPRTCKNIWAASCTILASVVAFANDQPLDKTPEAKLQVKEREIEQKQFAFHESLAKGTMSPEARIQALENWYRQHQAEFDELTALRTNVIASKQADYKRKLVLPESVLTQNEDARRADEIDAQIAGAIQAGLGPDFTPEERIRWFVEFSKANADLLAEQRRLRSKTAAEEISPRRALDPSDHALQEVFESVKTLSPEQRIIVLEAKKVEFFQGAAQAETSNESTASPRERSASK